MENPFWLEESHIRKLELELVTTDDWEKKKQLEILLKRAEDDLERKKGAYYDQKKVRQPSENVTNDDGIGCGWWLLGFFFAFPFAIIGWIILKIMKRNREASSLGWGIISSVLTAILITIILFVLNLFIFDSANKLNENNEIVNTQTTQTINMSSNKPLEQSAEKKERADEVRRIMVKNQGFDPDVLASIPDDDILEANAGNATNTMIAQTAKNLLDKYPNLEK